jgi:hypothetical protein
MSADEKKGEGRRLDNKRRDNLTSSPKLRKNNKRFYSFYYSSPFDSLTNEEKNK